MARVLVTRPQPGAQTTAGKLRLLGHEPIVLPLSEVRALTAVFPDAAAVDAVAITSANAVRFLPRQEIIRLADKPCFAVGERTARAASDAGFADVRASGGDGEDLAGLIASRMRRGSRVLYPCGRVRRPEFEAALASAAIRCVAIEVYDTVFPDIDPRVLRPLLGDSPPDVALVYSARSARALYRLVATGGASPCFQTTLFFCLSQQVADALGTIDPSRIYCSDEPSEDALLARLPAA